VRDGETATRQRDAPCPSSYLLERWPCWWLGMCLAMDRHVYSNDVSTCGTKIYRSRANVRSTARGHRNGRGIEVQDMAVSPSISHHTSAISHLLPCKCPMSSILKRYCTNHVPSAAKFGLSGGWSPASTRFGVGKLAAGWGVVNTGSYSPCTAKPKGRRSEKENAFGVADRRPRTGRHSICIATMF
jgi:hypothetical protein